MRFFCMNAKLYFTCGHQTEDSTEISAQVHAHLSLPLSLFHVCLSASQTEAAVFKVNIFRGAPAWNLILRSI